MKRCTHCKIEKDESEFPKNRNSKDGLNYWCKGCCRRDNKKLYEINKIKIVGNWFWEYGIPDNLKHCSKCDTWKDKKHFDKCSESKDGLSYSCKDCRKKYYIDNRQEILKKEKVHRFERALKFKYRITVEEHSSLMEKANNQCEMCGSKEDLCIDHNHITNKVRGILCRKCNNIIGMANDDIKILEEGIKYLKKTHSS